VRDRIVQKALHIVLEPIFERDFAKQSYGFRPGRNARQAVEQVESLLKEGKVSVVDDDIKGCFDNIPHEALMERVDGKSWTDPTSRENADRGRKRRGSNPRPYPYNMDSWQFLGICPRPDPFGNFGAA